MDKTKENIAEVVRKSFEDSRKGFHHIVRHDLPGYTFCGVPWVGQTYKRLPEHEGMICGKCLAIAEQMQLERT